MTSEEYTLAELGEFGLIARMTPRLPQTERALLGPGDDAAVLSTPDGRVVACADMLVEGRHFRRDWSSAEDVGRRAAAANLADVAAMGARPTGLLVSLCAPAELPARWLEELAAGIGLEAEAAGAAVIGGDTVSGTQLTVAVTALGDLEGRAPVTRSGAAAGDVLAVNGRLGWAAAGAAVLSRGFRSPGALTAAHRRPEPPYTAGVEAAVQGATAMIDVSDGLLADLGHVAAASKVAIDVDSTALPPSGPMRDAAQALGLDAEEWVLTGGDDHALAATFPPDVLLPGDWVLAGRVTAGDKVTVDGAAYISESGWDHFRSDSSRGSSA